MRLAPKTYTVDAVFDFYNSGERTTQWIGFRIPGSGPVDDISRAFTRFEFLSFEAWQNGKKIAVTEKRDFADKYPTGSNESIPPHSRSKPGFLVTEIVFSGHAITRIRVCYEAGYRRSPASNKVNYVIESGRYWKDRIRKALVVIDGSRVGGTMQIHTSLQPSSQPPRTLGEYLMRYELADFEGDSGVVVGIRISTLRRLQSH